MEGGDQDLFKLKVKNHLTLPAPGCLSPGPTHLAQALPSCLLQSHNGPSQGIAQGNHWPDEVLLLFGQGRQQVSC